MRSLTVCLVLSLSLAGCRDFSLSAEEDLPPEVERVRTYPAKWVPDGGLPLQAFTGQSFWIEGRNLTVGGTETPEVTVGGAQARIVAAGDTLVEAQVPAGLDEGEEQVVVLGTSVQEVEAARLTVLGAGHLAGQGDEGRVSMVSSPRSAALGPVGLAYVDALVGRVTALPRDPGGQYRHVMVRGDAAGWGPVVMPLEVAAAPGGFYVRVLSDATGDAKKHSAVGFAPELLLWPPADKLRADPILAVGCAGLPMDKCGEWKAGTVPPRGAAKLAYSAALLGVFWLDAADVGMDRTIISANVTRPGQETSRFEPPVPGGFEVNDKGYPVAFAVADPDPGAGLPGRLAVVTLDGEAGKCRVLEWEWTMGAVPSLSFKADRALMETGCDVMDAEFDTSRQLVIVDGRGALVREKGPAFEALTLPPVMPKTSEGHSAYSLAPLPGGAMLVGAASGVLRVAAGSPPDGRAPLEGFLATTGAVSRLARSLESDAEFVAVLERNDLLDASPPVVVLDARGPTKQADVTPPYSLSKLAYLESRGQLVSISLDLAHAVAGDLAYGLSYPVPQMSDWLMGFRGWACDGSRIAVASAGKMGPDGPTQPSVALFTFGPKSAEMGVDPRDLTTQEVPLPGDARDAMLGIATWGGDFVVAHRSKAQVVVPGSAQPVRPVAFKTELSIPAEVAPTCKTGSCDKKPAYGALTPVAADPVRGSLFLPLVSATPDLDAPSDSAPALVEVSLAGDDAGAARWTLRLPDDRIVFDLSLSRRGDVLAVAASPVRTLLYGREGGFSDAFVARRGEDDAWKDWCRLGRDKVTAVAVSPDGTRLYAGVAGGRVYEVASFECATANRVIKADPVPFAVLGDYYTAVSGLASSKDGTRLGYLLQGRTATFGFLQ